MFQNLVTLRLKVIETHYFFMNNETLKRMKVEYISVMSSNSHNKLIEDKWQEK